MWVGHHFQGQRSRSPGRFTHRGLNASGSCSGERENVLGVGNYCYVAVCSATIDALAPTEGGEWRGIWWRLPAYSLFCMRVNSLYVKCYTLNWKYGHEKTKYGIRFHLLLMCHVIPRMRNANFVNKCGSFGTSQYHSNVKNLHIWYAFSAPTCICHQITNKLCAWRHIIPQPLSPRGRPSACAPPSRRNIAVLSHAEYVPIRLTG